MAVISNGHNGDEAATHTGLKILVVGAGIGGLSAAIVLRQQGHHVEVRFPFVRRQVRADSIDL